MPENDNNQPGSFLAALKERQVIKTLLLYVAIGWGSYEIAAEILTRFGFDDRVVTLLLIFLLAGLPAALFLAWYFDVDRRGIRAEARLLPRDRAIILGSLLVPIVAVFLAKAYMAGGDLPDDTPAASVAVLPFSNLTGDASLDYLADGVAEEIISALTRQQSFDISAMTRSFAYRGSDTDIQAAGRDLGVAWVILGSVRSSGQLLRFSASIVDTRSGKSVWADSTEANRLSVFQGQDQLSSAVAMALASQAGVELPPLVAADAPDPEAYDLYLRGRHTWHRRGTVELATGVSMLSEATRIDPEFAKGWAALASAYLTWPSYSREGWSTWESSEEVALKAIELDPRLPEPYAVLATFAQQRRDWIGARDFYEESLRLDEKNATAHYWYGEHLASTGRYADSVRHMRRAIELNPAYEVPKSDLAFAYLTYGAIDLGAAEFANTWNAGFRSPANWMGNFMAHVLRGQFAAATDLVASSPLNEPEKALLDRFIAAQAGSTDTTLVEDLIGSQDARLDHRLVIWLVSRLGDYDAAMAYIAYRLDNDYDLDPRPLWGAGTRLYEHERFPELMDRLGLIEYWHATEWGDVCRPVDNNVVCDGYGMNEAALAAILEENH